MRKPSRSKRIQKLIGAITDVRAQNNFLWMDLLRLAMQYAPKEASCILGKITTNDRIVSDLTTELSSISED